MKVNSFKTMAAFMRAFFDAFSRGVIDASAMDKPQQETTTPKFVKQAMVEHYEEIFTHFMQSGFPALCRLNYTDFAQMMAAMPKEDTNNAEVLLQVACKTQELYTATINEYKRNFSILLSGRTSTLSEHFSSYSQGNQEALIEEPMAVHLLTRLIIQAYISGLQCASPKGKPMQTPSMPSLHSLLLSNTICLLQDSPITPKAEEEITTFFERVCKSNENINVLFNTLNETLEEIVKES